MARVLIGDLLTGRRFVDVPYLGYTWSQRLNEPEQLTAKVPLTDVDVLDLGLRSAGTPGKSYLAIIEEVAGGEWFAGAGQLNEPNYDQDDGSLDYAAKGILSYLDRRLVLPVSAATIPVTQFIIEDPVDDTKTIPNPAVATSLSGWSWGTIIKKWIAQAKLWPSGNVPIVLPADVAGTHDWLIEGAEFKSLADAISDVMRVEGGPEVAFPARFQPDRLGIEWELRTGTDAQPELRGTAVHRWDISAEQASTRRLRVHYNTENMGSYSWASGGRVSDEALVARASSPLLLNAGYPLMEIVDSSNTDVSDQAVLNLYAAENLARGQGATELWTFEVRKDEPPYLGQYSVGDACDLIVHGDRYIPDSTGSGYRREIAGLSGDEGPWVTVTTMEATD